jgi:uncharacterized membrane protein
MNPAVSSPPKPRQRYGRWIALGLVVLVTPLVVLGVGIFSMIRLDRDAAALKREVMAASSAPWHTKVQLSVGWFTLSALRVGLEFVPHEHRDEARLALQAVRSASVGVYECNSEHDELSREELFSNSDQTMRKRGWTRLVGVAEHNKTVLVYAADGVGSSNRADLCLAVVDGRKMVVVSTNVDSAALIDLAALHQPKAGLRGELNTAKLGF